MGAGCVDVWVDGWMMEEDGWVMEEDGWMSGWVGWWIGGSVGRWRDEGVHVLV